ncbi:MAG: hypothetical protein ACTTKF_07655, partial [Bacteroides sp.]
MCQNTTPLFASIHYAPYGGPKGGQPVVEERRRDNDQGGGKIQHHLSHRFIMRLTAQGVACCA